jgi:hypothetical protein
MTTTVRAVSEISVPVASRTNGPAASQSISCWVPYLHGRCIGHRDRLSAPLDFCSYPGLAQTQTPWLTLRLSAPG